MFPFDFYLLALYSITFIYYTIVWYLAVFDKRKQPKSLFELLFRRLFPVPFWVIFLYFLLGFASPMIGGYLHINTPKQVIIFENDSGKEIILQPAVINQSDKAWHPAYSMNQIYPVPLLTIPSGKTINLKYLLPDSSMRINFRVINRQEFDNAGYIAGKTFAVKYKPIKIYASDFNYAWQKQINLRYSNEMNMLALCLLSIFGIWFHVIIAKKKILWLALATLITALSGFMSYVLITII